MLEGILLALRAVPFFEYQAQVPRQYCAWKVATRMDDPADGDAGVDAQVVETIGDELKEIVLRTVGDKQGDLEPRSSRTARWRARRIARLPLPLLGNCTGWRQGSVTDLGFSTLLVEKSFFLASENFTCLAKPYIDRSIASSM